MKALQGLSVWNRACGLAVRTCEALRDCGDGVFRETMTRTALGLATSIAEGYERESKHQFAQLLRNARGTCAELRTQLYIAAQLDLMPLPRSTELMQETVEVARMLGGLIHWCEGRDSPPGRSPPGTERAEL